MKHVFFAVSVLILTAMLAGCFADSSGKTQSQTVPPDFRPGAIELYLKTDPMVNLYQGTPHTLVICVYELREPNSFNQLIGEGDGWPKLLECNRFDGSVAYVNKIVMQPDQEVKKTLDQAEGAKYIGLVAGYYLRNERPYRLYRITVPAKRKAIPMRMSLYLGPQNIQDLKVE